MSIEVIKPRFCETDALGHINNVSYVIWLEQARMQFIIDHLIPDLRDWSTVPYVVARIELNYKAETDYTSEVEVDTRILSIGSSSVTLCQQISQHNVLVVDAIVVMVHFDPQSKKATPFSEEQHSILNSLIER